MHYLQTCQVILNTHRVLESGVHVVLRRLLEFRVAGQEACRVGVTDLEYKNGSMHYPQTCQVILNKHGVLEGGICVALRCLLDTCISG